MDDILDYCIAAFPTNCSNDINFSNTMLLKIDAKYKSMINEDAGTTLYHIVHQFLQLLCNSQ